MLYLVNCEVTKLYYMDDNKTIEVNHIVEAETEVEAENKVRQYYSEMDNEYYVTYAVEINYCNKLIK